MNEEMIQKIVDAHTRTVYKFRFSTDKKDKVTLNERAATYERVLDMACVSYERDEFGFIYLTK